MVPYARAAAPDAQGAKIREPRTRLRGPMRAAPDAARRTFRPLPLEKFSVTFLRFSWHAMCAAALLAGFAQRVAAGPHQHGVGNLEISLDGGALAVRLTLPVESLVGFERAPKNEAEWKRAAAALEKLRATGEWLRPAAAGACALKSARLDGSVLDPAGAAQTKGGHADVVADVAFDCKAPAALKTIEVRLFEAFTRLKRIDSKVVTARGASAQALRRGDALVKLAP
jgi:hypothetical protein